MGKCLYLHGRPGPQRMSLKRRERITRHKLHLHNLLVLPRAQNVFFLKSLGDSFYRDSFISGFSGIQEPLRVPSLKSTIISLGNLGLVQHPPEILGLLKPTSSTKRAIAEVNASIVCCSDI